MKRVTITIASKEYNISLEENFAQFFEADLSKFLNDNSAIDIKELLTAYVQKCYECYKQNESMDRVSMKITEVIN